MRSLLRRILLAAALRLGPARKPAEGLRLQVTCDTSQARVDLDRLRYEIEHVAALAERRQVKCDLSVTMHTKIGRPT